MQEFYFMKMRYSRSNFSLPHAVLQRQLFFNVRTTRHWMVGRCITGTFGVLLIICREISSKQIK
ncbi:hypothetical protein T07_14197 [Trichinella nelsoni]|uniref:Uncharacterized protein n=1 Tax=Trichinella nelsoni TaxID=6336 RepID=A0A0V0RFS6_9BILA|nr:hypothetical protein T07_14197 [Trichinella nelsoni]